MPYPNFHAARVRDPDEFIEGTFRNVKIRPGVNLIAGKLKKDGKDGPMTAQSYHFDKSKFTVDQAKKWLRKHKIKTILFEPAEEKVEELTTTANITPNFQFGGFGIVKRKKKKEITDQKVIAVSAPSNMYALKGSYEELGEKIRRALIDNGNFGKFPEILSTFPKKVFIRVGGPEGEKYFEVEYSLEGDEVRLGLSREIERQVKFVVKEMAEEVKVSLLGRLDEKKWSKAFMNELPDSSFAYIEPGGEKDEEGKTYPRYLRHFPVKDKEGNWDKAHLINALARLKQIDKKTSPWLTDEARKKILSVIKAGYKALEMEWPEDLEEMLGTEKGVFISRLAEEVLSDIFEGGPGSGHWGHAGRPGMRGGSAPGGGVAFRVKGGLPKSLGAAALVDFGKYYTSSGGLKINEYKQLSEDMKMSVLKHGVESYKEHYIPKAQQGGLSKEAIELNKKIGALEGMRRSALKKAEGLSGKEQRAAYHIAVSLQERAMRLAGEMKTKASEVGAGTAATVRAAEAQPRA
jgi:hypothetical protein